MGESSPDTNMSLYDQVYKMVEQGYVEFVVLQWQTI